MQAPDLAVLCFLHDHHTIEPANRNAVAEPHDGSIENRILDSYLDRHPKVVVGITDRKLFIISRWIV